MGANALDIPKETGRPVSMASTLTSDQATVINDEKMGNDAASEKGAGSVRPGTEDSKAAVVRNDAGDGDDDNEYPSGLKMAFIVVALVLGIFLLALDMVRPFPPPAMTCSC